MSKPIQQVLEFIRETDGKIFSIKFIKRSDGSLREMTCRTGVKKYLAKDPKKPALDFKSHDLIAVYDMNAEDPEKGYRSIPIEGIKEIKIHGEWEYVDHQPRWFLDTIDVRENNLRVRATMTDAAEVQTIVHATILDLSQEEWALLAKNAFEINPDTKAFSKLVPIPLPFGMYGRVKYD